MAAQKEKEKKLWAQVDSLKNQELLAADVFKEIKAQYPFIKTAAIQPAKLWSDSSANKTTFVVLSLSGKLPSREKSKLENWLKSD